MSTTAAFLKPENPTRIQQNGKPVGYYHPFLDVFSIWMDNKGNLLTSQWCKKQEQGFGYKEIVFAGRTAAVRGVVFSKLYTNIDGR